MWPTHTHLKRILVNRNQSTYASCIDFPLYWHRLQIYWRLQSACLDQGNLGGIPSWNWRRSKPEVWGTPKGVYWEVSTSFFNRICLISFNRKFTSPSYWVKWGKGYRPMKSKDPKLVNSKGEEAQKLWKHSTQVDEWEKIQNKPQVIEEE